MTTEYPGRRTASSAAGATLDPALERFVSEMGSGWARFPDLGSVTPPEARRIAEAVRAPWTRGGPVMAGTIDARIPTRHGPVRARFHDPGPPGPKPALLYVHGGGWTLFSIDTHDRLLREYAGRSGAMVVGIDYALSPEARYPVALEQVGDALGYLRDNGDAHGIDPNRIALGGDSAGANLAVAACLALRDRGNGRRVAGMLLNYGVFARHSSPEAVERFGGAGNMLTEDEMESFWRNYLRDERDAADPLVCPLLADLRGLPPALLVIPACDLLAEQSFALAEGLRHAGVATKVRVFDGAPHSFLEAVSVAPIADRALADSSGWLRVALGSQFPP